MKQYTIYKADNKKVAVKNGFSWPAFFFSFLWSVRKGLMKQAIIIFAALIIINYGLKFLVAKIMHVGYLQVITQTSSATSIHTMATGAQPTDVGGLYSFIHLILYLVITITYGKLANKFLRQKLENSGYTKVGEVTAKSVNAALTA